VAQAVRSRVRIRIEGIVQGVGFRPFVYALAGRFHLSGFVTNTSRGVLIEVEGAPTDLDAFVGRLQTDKPPLAHLTRLTSRPLPLMGETEFAIKQSRVEADRLVLISPDVATCPDCLAELFDPHDRRFGYPFINCVNCGPRYTIIADVPYDRPMTTMARFTMCPDCRAEYDDPTNRRFHAQPNACPVCGPRVWLTDPAGKRIEADDPIATAAAWLAQGKIGAIKGLGGFHLAVDAADETAVTELRQRKGRYEKPLAIMARDLATAGQLGHFSDEEAAALASPQRPIVLIRRRGDAAVAPSVAPGNPHLGIMLPYTPLHHLLLRAGRPYLIMTSGNVSEEPIQIDNDEALKGIGHIADFFLMHDRDILLRSDDSVVFVEAGRTRQIRRSRGLVPTPIFLNRETEPILALGAELKNTICLTRRDHAFISQHIGDLDNAETLAFFELSIDHLARILQVKPKLAAHDLHPDYLSSVHARTGLDLPRVAVQHHHAHAVSCLAEHDLDEPVIAFCLDGTGFGPDGTVWGGECLIAERHGYTRRGRLYHLHLPGGDKAVKQPWRVALAALQAAFGPNGFDPDLPVVADHGPDVPLITSMIDRGVNAPRTSSLGRLFDAVAALIDLRQEVSFEGQAAMELEMILDRSAVAGPYPHDLIVEDELFVLDTRDLIRAVVEDLARGVTPAVISLRFHRTVIEGLARLGRWLRRETGLNKIVLSGGCLMNRYLMAYLPRRLEEDGFEVFTQALAPSNDGGISLGQAVAADAAVRRGLIREEVTVLGPQTN
jgi:hydrogenase maturation protein HypF